MLPHLSTVTMLLVWPPSAAGGCAAVWLGQLPYGGYGSPGATGEVSAWLPMRQRRVAANAGLSSPDSGTLT